jgi:hypothetical protein
MISPKKIHAQKDGNFIEKCGFNKTFFFANQMSSKKKYFKRVQLDDLENRYFSHFLTWASSEREMNEFQL